MLTRALFTLGNHLKHGGVQCARSISTTLPKFNANVASQANPNTNLVKTVDKLVANAAEGRLFAIVHLCGKQFRVTDGDIIMIEGYWPPTVGDQIRLDKVLLAGGRDFSLIGSPILQKGLVDIQATVIEKTMSHTKTNFKKKKTKQYMRINFERQQLTMVRINSIEIRNSVEKVAGAVEKVEGTREKESNRDL